MPPKGSTVPNYPKNRKAKPLRVNLTGKKFGKLTVKNNLAKNRSNDTMWYCKCECGNFVEVSTKHLNRKNNNVRSCGCLKKMSGKDHKDWNGIGDISGAWWDSRIGRNFRKGKRATFEVAIDKKHAWDLFLKQNRKCALSGVDLVISLTSNGNASLDRIDSMLGYIPGNVQWVHKHVNLMKNALDQKYFIEICKLIAEKK